MLTTQSKRGRDSGKSPTPTTTRGDVSTGTSTNANPPLLDIQKNSRERLRITHATFKGRPLVDLRIWYVDTSGDYLPSRSGVTIRPDQIAEVVRALSLAGREVSVESA